MLWRQLVLLPLLNDSDKGNKSKVKKKQNGIFTHIYTSPVAYFPYLNNLKGAEEQVVFTRSIVFCHCGNEKIKKLN